MRSEAARMITVNLLIIGLALPALYYGTMEVLAGQITRRINTRSAANTSAWLASEGQGFNPHNTYWVVRYDCRQTDVEITGIVPQARYWSIVAYDKYTMPLPSYLFDETVHKDSGGNYTVYLTTKPKGRANELDVSPSPQGIVLIRNSFPQDPEAVAKAVPTVRPLPRE